MKTVFLVGLLYIAVGAYCQKAAYIDSTFRNYAKINDSVNAEKVFACFPKTFKDFISLYGYNENKEEPMALYEKSKEHIHALFDCSEYIPKERFVKFIIEISQGGKWNADAENFLQGEIRKYYMTTCIIFNKILWGFPSSKKSLFWYYFFDSLYPKNQKYMELMAKIDYKNRPIAISSLLKVKKTRK